MQTSSSPIVELKQVTKSYPLGKMTVDAIRGISLSIPQGSLVCVVGPSGSGKSTLLNMIGLIDQPTNGDILLNGRTTNQLKDKDLTNIRLHEIGFIFQNFNLIPVLNVLENVEFPLILQNRLSSKKRKEKAMEFIEAVDLVDQWQQRTFSIIWRATTTSSYSKGNDWRTISYFGG